MREKRETIEEEPLDKSSVGVTEREPTIARKEGIPEGGEKIDEKLVISREEKTLEETTKRTATDDPDEEKEQLSIVENVQLNGYAASSSSQKQTDAQETEESHEAVKVIPKETFDPTENITYRSRQEDEKERAEALELIEQSSSDGKDLDTSSSKVRGTSPSPERTSRDKKTDDERAKVETGKPASIAYRMSYLLYLK